MNTEKQNQKVIDFFQEFKKHFPPMEYKNFKGEIFGIYPHLSTPEDKDYQGYYCILPGDDTEIKSSEDGESLIITDFHEDVDDMIFLRDEDVIEFYLGKDEAYNINYHLDKSIYFKKGFKSVAINLIDSIKMETNE